VFFLEYLDSSVNTPQHVWQAVGLSTFGVVPDLRSLNWRLLGWNFSARPLLQGLTWLPQQSRASSPPPELISIDHSLSLIAESYRTIRTAFLFSRSESPPQIVLLTSPLPGEGKTVTTLNLAIALAQDSHRVLVIDGDLRRGACHTRLRMKNNNGLSNVLTGNLGLEEGIQATAVAGLSLLSHGICPPNPTDLLGSRKMREILHHLRDSFNFILIDSPPAIPVSDAALLSTMCDGVILVFHGQKTTNACARQAVERLEAVRAPILGVILNGINLHDPTYAYYRNYYGSDGLKAQEPKNGGETIIEVSPDAGLSDIKTLGQPHPGIVPPEFFRHMVSKLRDVAGPMAPLIIQDQIALLGESLESFPKNRLNELIERVSEEILDQKRKKDFRQTLSSELRSL
jgi:capsular exopolysaccharide synthesis family protein